VFFFSLGTILHLGKKKFKRWEKKEVILRDFFGHLKK
jgi:hypothetical protein